VEKHGSQARGLEDYLKSVNGKIEDTIFLALDSSKIFQKTAAELNRHGCDWRSEFF